MSRTPKHPLKVWIVTQRQAKGWEAWDLAEKLGVTYSTVRGWEAAKGGLPSGDNLAALERLFGETAPDQTAGADLAPLVDALATALQAQAQAIVDIRLELRDTRQSAEAERAEMTKLLARLSEQLEAALAPAKRSGGSGARASARPA